MADIEEFKTCMEADLERALDFSAWTDETLQVLQEVEQWWGRQSEATRKFLGFLLDKAKNAAERFLTRVTTQSPELVLAFVGALAQVLAVVALERFMEAVGRCLVTA